MLASCMQAHTAHTNSAGLQDPAQYSHLLTVVCRQSTVALLGVPCPLPQLTLRLGRVMSCRSVVGCVENELGIREWLESKGHKYIVTGNRFEDRVRNCYLLAATSFDLLLMSSGYLYNACGACRF